MPSFKQGLPAHRDFIPLPPAATGTMLAIANVPPVEAQSYMRHSDIRLTLQVYADAGVVGVGNVVNAVNAMSNVPA